MLSIFCCTSCRIEDKYTIENANSIVLQNSGKIKHLPTKEKNLLLLAHEYSKVKLCPYETDENLNLKVDRIGVVEYDLKTQEKKLIYSYPDNVYGKKTSILYQSFLYIHNNLLFSAENTLTNDMILYKINLTTGEKLAITEPINSNEFEFSTTVTFSNLIPSNYFRFTRKSNTSNNINKIGIYDIGKEKIFYLELPKTCEGNFFETKNYLYFIFKEMKISKIVIFAKSDFSKFNIIPINQLNLVGHDYESNIIFLNDQGGSKLSFLDLRALKLIKEINLNNCILRRVVSKTENNYLYILAFPPDFLDGLNNHFFQIQYDIKTTRAIIRNLSVKEKFIYFDFVQLPNKYKLVSLIKDIDTNNLKFGIIDFKKNEIDFMPIEHKLETNKKITDFNITETYAFWIERIFEYKVNSSNFNVLKNLDQLLYLELEKDTF
jgi:hypothetical protein